MSDLLDMAIDAHGSLELWRGLKRITVDKTIGGTLFQLKGQDTLAATRFAIDPHRPHAIYTPEEIAIRVVYNGDAEVSVETGAGRVLERRRSEEHTSELQSLMRISYAVFCLKQKK